MARDFDAGDKITTGFSSHATARTYHIKALTDGAGGGGRGRFFEKRVAGAEVEIFYYNTTDANQPYIEYDRVWSGTDGRWRTPTSSLTLDQWVDIILTYDGGATTNDPLIYLDGVSQTITQLVGDPTGSLDTNADAYVIGNRGNDDARDFNGKLAEFAIWDRILGAGEIAALAAGFSPLFIPNSLVSYCPLVRNMIDLKNGAITDDATAEFPHPRIIYPSLAQISHLAAAAPASAFLSRLALMGAG